MQRSSFGPNITDHCPLITRAITMPSDDANVFLSWSGPLSRAIATELRDWLPDVVRDAVPWMSAEDIAKGSVWSTEINQQLGKCKVGIIVLTRQNLAAPWVLWEAGAIFKAMPDRSVCTLLCDFSPPVTGPLGQFQATEFTECDCLRLCRDVSALVSPGAAQDRLEKWFRKHWPELKAACDEARRAYPPSDSASAPKPDIEEILRDMLAGIQAIQRQQGDFDARLLRIDRRGLEARRGRAGGGGWPLSVEPSDERGSGISQKVLAVVASLGPTEQQSIRQGINLLLAKLRAGDRLPNPALVHPYWVAWGITRAGGIRIETIRLMSDSDSDLLPLPTGTDLSPESVANKPVSDGSAE